MSKFKKIAKYFILLFFAILILSVISKIYSQKKSSQTLLFKNNASVPILKNVLSPEEQKTISDLLENASPENLGEIEKILDTEASVDIEKTTENFDKIISETDKKIMSVINPLLKKVKVDSRKKDIDYTKEIEQKIGEIENLNTALYDSKNLKEASNYFQKKALILSNINPSKNFESFHLFWIAAFASKAYIFKALQSETNEDTKYILLNILDKIVDSENQMLNSFAGQK